MNYLNAFASVNKMNTNETKNENTVQKPCSNTSKSGANVDKSRGSGKRMNMSPILDRYFI